MVDSNHTESGTWRQFLAAIIVNMSALAYGMAMGFSSPSMILLQSVDTPVGNTPLSDEQISWLNSAIMIGGLVVLPFCSFISEKLGRRLTGCIAAIPSAICWLLTIFGTNYTCIVIGHFCAGLSGAMSFFLISIYITEISNNCIRGQLGSFLKFAFNIGILLGYIFGAILSYRLFAICALTIPIIYLGLFSLMPETPIYLVRKNRIAEATRSLMWLKSNDKSAVTLELLRLESFVKDNCNDERSVGVRDLFRDRGTTKGFIIALALLGGQQLTGILAVIAYSSKIFKLGGSSLTPNSSAIVIGAIQVFGSWLSTILMESMGRKLLILLSCMGMTICHLIMGTLLYMHSNSYDISMFGWVPVISLSFYVILYCMGVGPASYIVSSEVFKADIAGLANSIGHFFMWTVALLVLKFFSTLATMLGMHWCFFLLSCFCIFTFMFTYFIVPETKGRSIESIYNELNDSKRTDSSHSIDRN